SETGSEAIHSARERVPGVGNSDRAGMLDALGGFAIAILYEEADRIELIRGMFCMNSDVFRDFQKLGTLHNTLGAQGEFKGLAARAALFTRHVGNRRCE